MQKDELILISVDDHIIEPPDMFAGRLPAKYADDAPRLVHRDDGTDVWQFRTTTIPNSALNGITGSGILVTMIFQAVGKGSTTITLPNFTMRNSQGQVVSSGSPQMTITVK